MSNDVLDFDDWTAQITKAVNSLRETIFNHNVNIMELESAVKKLQDHNDGK